MAHINRKYIDSHWLIFIIRGTIATLCAILTIFSVQRDFDFMISVSGIFLLSLSIVEFINSLYRARSKTGWAVSVGIAIADAVIALALLFTLGQDLSWHLYLISLYAFVRGLFEIISGFRATVDPTDRFLWILSGVSGAVMGIVILNSGEYFIRFFGIYLLIFGLTGLVYAVHNRAQQLEDKAARKESARLAASSRKTTAKKNSRNSGKKSTKSRKK
ncbi:DUF308 domain-containing protein [Candidatus Saccharibacteria bacterium]|nr:DUF308 domain-containing protein [Candidatus Saccharibacteria bacterium]